MKLKTAVLLGALSMFLPMIASAGLITVSSYAFSPVTLTGGTIDALIGAWLITPAPDQGIRLETVGIDIDITGNVELDGLRLVNDTAGSVQMGATIPNSGPQNVFSPNWVIPASFTELFYVFGTIGSGTHGTVQASIAPGGVFGSGVLLSASYSGPTIAQYSELQQIESGSAVPEPTMIELVGGGIIALAAFRRRNCQRAKASARPL